eukprot:5632023-Ditylum_brightwellii.AAC.1
MSLRSSKTKLQCYGARQTKLLGKESWMKGFEDQGSVLSILLFANSHESPLALTHIVPGCVGIPGAFSLHSQIVPPQGVCCIVQANTGRMPSSQCLDAGP